MPPTGREPPSQGEIIGRGGQKGSAFAAPAKVIGLERGRHAGQRQFRAVRDPRGPPIEIDLDGHTRHVARIAPELNKRTRLVARLKKLQTFEGSKLKSWGILIRAQFK